MKILVMCEGANEEKIIEMLLDSNKLKFTRDDLIGRKPYNVRQLNNPFIKSELKRYNRCVTIYRIGDKQSDKLTIPKDLKNIVFKENIYKYCTKPELEVLLIINEKMYNKYQKSKNSPKEFAKGNIIYNRRHFDQSTDFLNDYYINRVDNLVNNLIEYKKLKKHDKDELYVADLLK